MSESVRWIDSTSWEPAFFGLPQHLPWPAEVDPAIANREPFDVDHLLHAIELLGPEAPEPWSTFLASADHFSELIDALQENEIGPAIAALDAIDRLLPGTAFVLFHRAYIARREGIDQEAIRLYRLAGEKTPQVAAIWNNLGILLAMRGQREEAVTAYKRALKAKPNDPHALEGLASLRELVKLKSSDPRRPDAVKFVDLPTFHSLVGQQVLSMTDAEELVTYGEQLLRDGSAVPAAVQALERSASLRPGQARTMHALAAAYRMNSQLPQARETLSRLVQLFPQDPTGYLHLAQTCAADQDETAEMAALEEALRLDPNLQQALAARFRLAPGEHDPAREDALAAFGEERQSWMAHLLAATLARERADHPASLRRAERAFQMKPDAEEVLMHFASSLGEMRDFARLAEIIRPAVESGRYSRRLDWHYAHVLRGLNLTADALAVLERAVSGEVPAEFRQMVTTTTDAWKGLVTGCGVRIEMLAAGLLQRPIHIALGAEGDGGVLLHAGAKLPAEAKFTWRAAAGDKTAVALQQGESEGGRPPKPLGVFRIRRVDPAGPPTLDCHLAALPDGGLHFRAAQAGRKLEVSWVLRDY